MAIRLGVFEHDPTSVSQPDSAERPLPIRSNGLLLESGGASTLHTQPIGALSISAAITKAYWSGTSNKNSGYTHGNHGR